MQRRDLHAVLNVVLMVVILAGGLFARDTLRFARTRVESLKRDLVVTVEERDTLRSKFDDAVRGGSGLMAARDMEAEEHKSDEAKATELEAAVLELREGRKKDEEKLSSLWRQKESLKEKSEDQALRIEQMKSEASTAERRAQETAKRMQELLGQVKELTAELDAATQRATTLEARAAQQAQAVQQLANPSAEDHRTDGLQGSVQGHDAPALGDDGRPDTANSVLGGSDTFANPPAADSRF